MKENLVHNTNVTDGTNSEVGRVRERSKCSLWWRDSVCIDESAQRACAQSDADQQAPAMRRAVVAFARTPQRHRHSKITP
jgi:hypothetical protein